MILRKSFFAEFDAQEIFIISSSRSIIINVEIGCAASYFVETVINFSELISEFLSLYCDFWLI